MTGFGRTAGAVLAACVFATTAEAQAVRTDTGVVATFAREWSTGLGGPRCERESLLEGGTEQCTWGAAQSREAPWLQWSRGTIRGAPSLVMWHRLTSDTVHAGRIVDSLDAALVARGAVRRACGTGEVPAGRTTTTVWESDALVVHLSAIQDAIGGPRLLVAATDRPSAMPIATLCPRSGATARRTDTSRVYVLDPGALVFPPGAVVQVATLLYDGDSALAVVHYRTGRPVADSAAVRHGLASRLSRPGALDDDPVVQASVTTNDGRRAEVWRLVVRPCWTEECPTYGPERLLTREPGDFVFVRQPDRSWRAVP